MKTVILWSSANTDGLTAAAKDTFLAGLHEQGIETEDIFLNGLTIRPCLACGNGFGQCLSDGSCVQEDDFATVYKKLVEADGIVLVTAVYFHDLTEQFKLFIDRLRRCEALRDGDLKGKTCTLVACAGGSGNGAVECLNIMETTVRHMKMTPTDRISITRYNRDYMLPALRSSGARYAQFLTEGGND